MSDDMGDPSEDHRVVPTVKRSDDQRQAMRGGGRSRVLPFACDVARLLNDLHFEDVKLLDVRGLSDVTDYVLIASGTSSRQISAVSSDIGRLAKTMGLERYGLDEDENATWLVLDFVDCIVHLFEPATRAHYDLEMMWNDAPKVRWRRPD